MSAESLKLFRGILSFAEGFKVAVGAPIKWLFGARGGYLSDIKRATATRDVFAKIVNVLGLIYTVGMPKFDAIAKYTRIAATVLSGSEPSEPMPTRYSMFQKIKAIARGKSKIGGKGGMQGLAFKLLGLNEKELEEAGIKDFGDLGKVIKELGKEVYEGRGRIGEQVFGKKAIGGVTSLAERAKEEKEKAKLAVIA